MGEYFDVVTADNGRDAFAICEKGQVDLILLDVMMPEMDGFEVCERIRAMPEIAGVPVVMVTELKSPRDRLRGFKSGADEVKPVNDLVLVSRIRNLLGRSRWDRVSYPDLLYQPSTLVVGMLARDIDDAFRTFGNPVYYASPNEALARASSGDIDLVVVHHDLVDCDPLRFCSQLRSKSRTRDLPIILVVGDADDEMTMKAFDIGVTDCLFEPLNIEELTTRVLNMPLRRAGTSTTPAGKSATVLSGVRRIRQGSQGEGNRSRFRSRQSD